MARIDNLTVQWLFNSSPNPWSEGSEDMTWEHYDDIESERIEEAFQDGRETVQVGSYYIVLRSSPMVQVHKANNDQRSPVRREARSIIRNSRVRSNRFNVSDGLRTQTFHNTGVSMSPFIEEWIRRNPLYRYAKEMIEQLACGIEREGAIAGQSENAEYFARQIRLRRDDPQEDIAKYCVNLYTKDSFLYPLINATLRKNDMSKVDTLGPFCWLMESYISTPVRGYRGEKTVFRGMNLNTEDLEKYKGCIGEVHTWSSFSSTTRSRNVAENFGEINVLFVINFDRGTFQFYPGRNIADVSDFEEEEEVLLQPGADFRIEAVEKHNHPNIKNIIKISLV